MDDFLKAMKIFRKYMDDDQLEYPFQCEHDTLYVNCNAVDVTLEDAFKLDELGFTVEDADLFVSYRFGSF